MNYRKLLRADCGMRISIRYQFKKATKTDWKKEHIKIEKKWTSLVSQSFTNLIPSDKQAALGKLEKKYILSMFPYPSGKLHMGHVRVYSISDAFAKFYHLRGYSVIHPMGWDAFGLPAENAAIERGKDPCLWTKSNISYMKSLLERLACSFDWEREISTCDPGYYRWTQYIFTRLFKKGLAYQKESSVNWDPAARTVLANEQVDSDGKSWRSGAKVEKKFLKQWYIKANRFSEQLVKDMDDSSLVNWERTSALQKSWIGECTGHAIILDVIGENNSVHGQLSLWLSDLTSLGQLGFIGIHPDHELSENDPTTRILKYHIREPLSGRILPIVICKDLPYYKSLQVYPAKLNEEFCLELGLDIPIAKTVSNSETEILAKLHSQNIDVHRSSPLVHDWLISRQRYWGTPIPIVHCPTCGPVCVPEEQLPVPLPSNKEGNTFLPLKEHNNWKNTECPKCHGAATRETDTMDTFVDSSWYYMRYLDSKNTKELIGKDVAKSCLPVDLYIGGIEHAIRHLFYARLIHKILVNEGIAYHNEPFKELLVQGFVKSKAYVVKSSGKFIPADEVDLNAKPLVEKSTGEKVVAYAEKMSKSKHNGVDALQVLEDHGIDVTRLAILSSAPPEDNIVWSSQAIPEAVGILYKLWGLVRQFAGIRSSERTENTEDMEEHRLLLAENRNKAIGSVTSSNLYFRDLAYSISTLKQLMNIMRKVPLSVIWDPEYEKTLRALLIMFYPVCPHISAEAWAVINEVTSSRKDYIFEQPWPQIDSDALRSIMVMVNDEKVDRILISPESYDCLTLEEAMRLSLQSLRVQSFLRNNSVQKKSLSHFREDDRCFLRLQTLSEEKIQIKRKKKRKL